MITKMMALYVNVSLWYSSRHPASGPHVPKASSCLPAVAPRTHLSHGQIAPKTNLDFLKGKSIDYKYNVIVPGRSCSYSNCPVDIIV